MDTPQTTLDQLLAKSEQDAARKKRMDMSKALLSYAGDPTKQQYVDGIAVQSSPLDALSKLGMAAAGAYVAKKNQPAQPAGKGTQPPAPQIK